MMRDKSYYTELKVYELVWENHRFGFELSDVQRMVYNPCIKAKQVVIFSDGIRSMTVKITEAVADTMRRTLSCTMKMLG